MSLFHDRLQAEADLSWYHNECQALMSIGAQCYDPEANIGGGQGWDFKDRQWRAAMRARPIRQTLYRCGRRTQCILRLRFEERAYRGELAVKYLSPFGPRLAAIVMTFRPKGNEGERRLIAQAWCSEAIREYVEVKRAA